MSYKRDLDSYYWDTYNVEAEKYDQRCFGSTKGEYSARYKNETALKLLARYGGLHEDVRIIDCLSGTGRFTHAVVSNRYQIGRFEAVDISEEKLKVN